MGMPSIIWIWIIVWGKRTNQMFMGWKILWLPWRQESWYLVSEVNGNDLVTVDSAVSLFFAFVVYVVSKPQLSALESLLKEWEGSFENEDQTTENKETQEVTKWQDDWNEEVEQDDGWATFQEPKAERGKKPNRVLSAHTFHSCWMIILKRLIEQYQLEEVLQLLDVTSSNKSRVLLTEVEAWNSTSMLANVQPVVASKSALLFTYVSFGLKRWR